MTEASSSSRLIPNSSRSGVVPGATLGATLAPPVSSGVAPAAAPPAGPTSTEGVAILLVSGAAPAKPVPGWSSFACSWPSSGVSSPRIAIAFCASCSTTSPPAGAAGVRPGVGIAVAARYSPTSEAVTSLERADSGSGAPTRRA